MVQTLHCTKDKQATASRAPGVNANRFMVRFNHDFVTLKPPAHSSARHEHRTAGIVNDRKPAIACQITIVGHNLSL